MGSRELADLSKVTASVSASQCVDHEPEIRCAVSLLQRSALERPGEELFAKTSSLEQQLQAANVSINQFDSHPQGALANLAAAEASYSALKESVAEPGQ